jgi:hypothetical protein
MGTRGRRREYGLVQHGDKQQWTYRDQAHPQRTVVIRLIEPILSTIAFWRNYEIKPYYQVHLRVKKNPRIHQVEGDLLDAMAKAAEIINTPVRKG